MRFENQQGTVFEKPPLFEELSRKRVADSPQLTKEIERC